MAPTRALINAEASQHPQHASTGINPSFEKKKSRKKAGFSNPGDKHRAFFVFEDFSPYSYYY